MGRNDSQKATDAELDVLNVVFNGSAAGLMAGALSAKKASREELTEIRDYWTRQRGTKREQSGFAFR